MKIVIKIKSNVNIEFEYHCYYHVLTCAAYSRSAEIMFN